MASLTSDTDCSLIQFKNMQPLVICVATDIHQIQPWNKYLLLKICSWIHRSILKQVPVYRGAEKSLVGTQGDSSFYHGKDGLGDVPDPDPVDEALIMSEHAVTAMLSMSKKYKGEQASICWLMDGWFWLQIKLMSLTLSNKLT